VVVLAVGIVVMAILLAGLMVLVARAGIGEQRTERLTAGLVLLTTAPSRLLAGRRPSWRARPGGGHGEESRAPSPEPASEPRGRRRRRRGPAVEDPAEVERLVRDQLYGRQGRGG
jgi:hypothetical protein